MKEERLEPIIVNMHFDSLEETSEKILKKTRESLQRESYSKTIQKMITMSQTIWTWMKTMFK